MAERPQDYSATSTIDILDRVLDKGIVIDGWWRFYVGGLHLMTVDARVVVASIETYLRHAPMLAQAGSLSFGDIDYSLPASDLPPRKKSRVRRR
jgi:gas vesicle structural protein